MIKKLSFIVFSSLILLLACQTTPTVFDDDLLGAWVIEGAGFAIEFKKDASYTVGAPDPPEFGEFRLEDTTLTITTTEEARICPGLKGIYEIELTDDGKLHWTLVEDECSSRAENADGTFWSRVSP
jgi:hypothetical protein